MNPIYKFDLTVNGTTQRAYPIYNNELSLSFEKETGQEFFRRKLSGELEFQSVDYRRIVAAAFDTRFGIVISISYNAGATWSVYWSGEFWKTDCKFDADSETVTVTPSVKDQYTDVLAGIEKEYNLIDLKPEITPVKADKRPMVQVYVPGQSVVGCFLSGMWWEQEAEPESDETKLVNDFHFSLNKTMTVAEVSGSMSPQLPNLFSKVFSGNERFNPQAMGTQEFPNTDYKLIYTFSGSSHYTWAIVRLSDNVILWNYEVTNQYPPQLPVRITLNPVSGTGATGNVPLYVHDIPVYSRFVLDTPQISGLDTYPIPADDIVENNRNYTRVIGYYFPDTIYFSTSLTSTPNQWGLYQPGQYYQQPYLYWNPELFPVARNAWGRVSIWFTFSAFDWIVEESGRQSFTIRHAYPLASVISVLLAKIAPGITHKATTDYSEFLYGTNLIGITQTLLITPKSNIISAGYDQPAQKAPITLKNVLDMLRDCFRCYWFVDGAGRLRIEHIQYFRNGGSYSVSPVVGIDLTTQKVPRNGKEWAFGRNQFQFDKPGMAARYQFGWMDDVTQLFEGFPIDIISKYVNPDNIEQIDVSKFTSDIDYILLNPGAISKDGFVLLAATESVKFEQGSINGGAPVGTNYYDMLISASNTIRSIGLLKKPNDTLVCKINSPGYGFGLGYFDNNNDFLGFSGWRFADVNLTFSATRIAILIVKEGYAAITPDEIRNVDIEIGNIQVGKLMLPYYNYIVDANDHYLQNAYAAFCILQEYYAFDMPARNYEINGITKIALGVKKFKTQTIRFPVMQDPDLVKSIKTNLGNGVIDKISVNLSSREANATLRYDTE